jgi:hypothetical protein
MREGYRGSYALRGGAIGRNPSPRLGALGTLVEPRCEEADSNDKDDCEQRRREHIISSVLIREDHCTLRRSARSFSQVIKKPKEIATMTASAGAANTMISKVLTPATLPVNGPIEKNNT